MTHHGGGPDLRAATAAAMVYQESAVARRAALGAEGAAVRGAVYCPGGRRPLDAVDSGANLGPGVPALLRDLLPIVGPVHQAGIRRQIRVAHRLGTATTGVPTSEPHGSPQECGTRLPDCSFRYD